MAERACAGILGPPQDRARCSRGPRISIHACVTCSRTLGCKHRGQTPSNVQRAAPPERGLSCTQEDQRRHAGFLPKKKKSLKFGRFAARLQRKRGERKGRGEAQILLQSCCFAPPSPGQLVLRLQPSPPSHVTCPAAAFRLLRFLPFLLACCLLGVDNKQQIDRYCAGISLKVHGTHQSMARAPVLPPSCCCCELPCLFSTLGKASTLPPTPPHRPAGPANCTMSALPKPTLMKRLQVTFERKLREGSIS